MLTKQKEIRPTSSESKMNHCSGHGYQVEMATLDANLEKLLELSKTIFPERLFPESSSLRMSTASTRPR
jgi:hypothetical protein